MAEKTNQTGSDNSMDLRGRRRAFLLVVLVGVAFCVYGAAFHSVPVIQEKPPAEKPQAASVPPDPSLPPDFLPPPPPPAAPEKVTLVLHEPPVIFDVTVGGLAKLASGEIKRTYAGKPAKACPT